MSDRTDKRVTTLEAALAAWKVGMYPIFAEAKTDADEALASLAADAAETQTLRKRVEALERELNRAGFVLGISGNRRESIEYVLDKTVAERDAAVADRDRLAGLLRQARGYVEEPGLPGTQIVTTEESAARSLVLLSEIRAALAGREGSDDATRA